MNVDEYSKHAIEILWAYHPEWRGLERIDKNDEQEKGYFYLEVPSPSGSDLEAPLFIVTENQEITVGMDYCHAHYDFMGNSDETGECDVEALPFIEDLLKERLSVVSWWSGDAWKGSGTMESGSTPEASKYVSSYDRIRVRSWKGTYDKDIDISSEHHR